MDAVRVTTQKLELKLIPSDLTKPLLEIVNEHGFAAQDVKSVYVKIPAGYRSGEELCVCKDYPLIVYCEKTEVKNGR